MKFADKMAKKITEAERRRRMKELQQIELSTDEVYKSKHRE